MGTKEMSKKITRWKTGIKVSCSYQKDREFRAWGLSQELKFPGSWTTDRRTMLANYVKRWDHTAIWVNFWGEWE